MPRKKLLIVDDSVTIQAIIEGIFSSSKEIDIVGRAGTGEAAIALVERLRPSVVTLDLNLPGIDGFEVLRFIMAEAPASVIIVSTLGTRGSDLCEKALALGAYSCFDKSDIIAQAPKFRRAVLGAAIGRKARNS